MSAAYTPEKLRILANIAPDATGATRLLPATRELLREAAAEIEALEADLRAYREAATQPKAPAPKKRAWPNLVPRWLRMEGDQP